MATGVSSSLPYAWFEANSNNNKILCISNVILTLFRSISHCLFRVSLDVYTFILLHSIRFDANYNNINNFHTIIHTAKRHFKLQICLCGRAVCIVCGLRHVYLNTTAQPTAVDRTTARPHKMRSSSLCGRAVVRSCGLLLV